MISLFSWKKRGGRSKKIKIFKEKKLILKPEGVLKSGTHNLALYVFPITLSPY
jgi:hypothetical protein